MVKNLKITNSYFESSVADLGSVAGWSKGNPDWLFEGLVLVKMRKRYDKTI